MPIRRESGLAAAAALAIVTLGTFAIFQNYGPESAVRRFHHAVSTGNDAELAQVSLTDPQSSSVKELKEIVRGATNSNAGYRIVKSERSKTQVEMLTLYQRPPPIIWVVVKANDRWRVDAYSTVQGLRKLGF